MYSYFDRLQIYDLESLLADSGDIYDTRITGGRVGVYQFGQGVILWSDLRIQCLPSENKALYLDGIDDYVTITNISHLDIYRRYFLFYLGLGVRHEIITQPKHAIPCTLMLGVPNVH